MLQNLRNLVIESLLGWLMHRLSPIRIRFELFSFDLEIGDRNAKRTRGRQRTKNSH